MLTKLFKYELKYIAKFISIFYVLAIFFAILTRVFSSINKTIMIEVIEQICMGAMFSMMASSLINTLMRNWIRFKENIYGDESYLTHTLPVNKKDIYESKFILALLNLVITFIVIIICLFIAFYTKDNWLAIKNFLLTYIANFNMSLPLFLILVILLIFEEIFTGLQGGLLGIILGYKMSNNKVGYSVLFGFIIYICSQLIVLLTMYIFGIFNKDYMMLFTSNSLPNIEILKGLIITVIIIYLAVNIIINLLSVKIFNKGVNVE